MSDLVERLAAVPEPELPRPPAWDALIDGAIAWLGSDDAVARARTDAYWPKWTTPWWTMLALYELGEGARIPPRIAGAIVDTLNAMPLHTFPLRDEDWPPHAHRKRHSMCHCALGCIDQVLAAAGVDVDRELPWVAPWYARYQLADGGYNCDEGAYLCDECPSSMVGTIAPFEALIRRGPSEACDRAAAMLIERELRHGSPTAYNAEERTAARVWPLPCFPRFYFYDVLRGAAALVRWAREHRRPLPLAALAPVLEHLLAIAPDGIVRIGRVAWTVHGTIIPDDDWQARHAATPTPLQLAIGAVGAPSPPLTQQWTRTRRDLLALVG